MLSDEVIRLSVANIARYGDTDVFPYPFETHIFHDSSEKVVELLKALDQDFDRWLAEYPPVYVKALSTAGYSGFRAPTQIDPFWNAYFLALTLALAPEIESARLPTTKQAIFSYRHKIDLENAALFDRELGWSQFQSRSLELAGKNKNVLACDISDFYPRIYHHRLENALKRATDQSDIVGRLMRLLSKLSDGVSYGLPIGGAASRILAEVLLNRIDRLLQTRGIVFCRFVDDFHLFADSQEESYDQLIFLSQALMDNEGMALQRTKTRIMGAEEFISSSRYAGETSVDSENELKAKRFMQIRLHYDPYSPTADEDWESLRGEVVEFDIVGMLGRELRKSRIDEGLTRHLVKSIRYLDKAVIQDTVLSLIDNLSTLYPLFPTVSIVILQLLDELDSEVKAHVFSKLRALFDVKSYIVQVPANMAYSVRVLSEDRSDETETTLGKLYLTQADMIIKRDVILAMAKRGADYWISDVRKRYATLSPWEKRALLVSSYILGDEGKHWRTKIKGALSPADLLVLNWAAERKQTHGNAVTL